MSLFDAFDGSGRTPRDVQVKALQWVESHLHKPTISLRLPTSSGKSAIAVAILKAFPDKQVCIVCPNNILVKQYIDEYNLIHLIGKKVMGIEERAEARDLVLGQRKSFVTNSSWLIHNRIGKWGTKCSPDITIIDEVDQCVAYSRNEQSTTFDIKTDNPFVIKDYLRRNVAELHWEKAVFENAMKHEQEFFMWSTEEEKKTTLHYTYLDSLVANALKGKDTTILMSATLSVFDHKELIIRKTSREIFDGEHPIDARQRPVVWEPTPFHFDENIKELALTIADHYRTGDNRNTLVHVTYEDQKKIYPYLRELLGDKVIYNEPSRDSKDSCVSCLRARDGVLWLGAGVSEGLDLKEDLCRLQIIPRIIFPNLGDTFVQKRMSLTDGNTWYFFQALRHLLQSSGRACRGPRDYGRTVILDSRLPDFMCTWKWHGLVPKWFTVEGV